MGEFACFRSGRVLTFRQREGRRALQAPAYTTSSPPKSACARIGRKSLRTQRSTNWAITPVPPEGNPSRNGHRYAGIREPTKAIYGAKPARVARQRKESLGRDGAAHPSLSTFPSQRPHGHGCRVDMVIIMNLETGMRSALKLRLLPHSDSRFLCLKYSPVHLAKVISFSFSSVSPSVLPSPRQLDFFMGNVGTRRPRRLRPQLQPQPQLRLPPRQRLPRLHRLQHHRRPPTPRPGGFSISSQRMR